MNAAANKWVINHPDRLMTPGRVIPINEESARARAIMNAAADALEARRQRDLEIPIPAPTQGRKIVAAPSTFRSRCRACLTDQWQTVADIVRVSGDIPGKAGDALSALASEGQIERRIVSGVSQYREKQNG